VISVAAEVSSPAHSLSGRADSAIAPALPAPQMPHMGIGGR
jgi:hypothetical protein